MLRMVEASTFRSGRFSRLARYWAVRVLPLGPDMDDAVISQGVIDVVDGKPHPLLPPQAGEYVGGYHGLQLGVRRACRAAWLFLPCLNRRPAASLLYNDRIRPPDSFSAASALPAAP